MENRVRLQFDDAIDVIEAVCTNISIGGMQVSTENPRPSGSLVRFDLEIEEGVSLRGLGEVVWMRTGSPSVDPGPGMGIKFRFIEQRDRQLIYKIVSEHIKERLAHKHPALEEPAEALSEMSDAAESRLAEPPAQVGGTAWEDDEPLEPPAPSFQETRPLDLEEPFSSTDRPSEDAEPRTDDGFVSPSPAFSPDDSFDEVPEDVDVAERRYRVGELYHPRPARRREFPAIPAVLLLLLVGVVIVYVYWDDLIGPSSPDAAPAAVSTQDEGPGVPDPGVPDPGVPDPGGLQGESPPPVDEPPLSIATDETPDAGSRAEPARNPPPPPPPEPEPPPPPRARPFTLVEKISWTRTPGGVKIEIETNGAIPQNRFSHFRLEGENPREVVKLTGVARQFERGTIPVSGAAVSQIRVGYHPGPKELHVVLDMRDRSTRIARLRSEGSKLEVYLE